MKLELYRDIRRQTSDKYPKTLERPKKIENSTEFGLTVVYVIINSGMKWTIAQDINSRVKVALLSKGVIEDEFKHPGKRDAINQIWKTKDSLFSDFNACMSDNVKVQFCQSIPWIGKITKYHLAKNLGVDCVKPDRHLVGIAEKYHTTPDLLCAELSKSSGDTVSIVDTVIWRACEMGLLKY